MGEDLVLKAIRKQSVQLVVLAADTGAASAKKLTDKSSFYKVPVIADFDKNQIGSAIGLQRTVVAVNDANFAKRLIELSK